MSVHRRELVRYLERNGFRLLREGKHSIYVKGLLTVPVKRHRIFDPKTANKLCKQAGLAPIF